MADNNNNNNNNGTLDVGDNNGNIEELPKLDAEEMANVARTEFNKVLLLC